jgi:hypothetical protein
MTGVRRAAAALSCAVVLVLALSLSAAQAFWSVRSTPGGAGASAAAALGRGAKPTLVASGSAVTVDWADGTPATGYLVKRYDATTLAAQAILTSCTGTVSGNSCTETSVPGGEWVYSVTPLVGSHWTGTESQLSDAVTIDTTPPVNHISATVVTGNAALNGSTIFYRGVAAGSFTLTNAATDSGSGPASSSTADLAGSPTGWTHTASTVTSPAGGPYVSNLFSWMSGASSALSEVVTGRDVAGNGADTTLTLTNDSDAPSAGTITYPDGYQPGQAVEITFAPGTDTGSGVASRQLQRSSAVLSSGSCGAFSGFANVGTDSPASPYSDTQVSDGSCYEYRYVVTDRVGNQDVATSPNVALVDSNAGGPALGTAATFSVLAGTGVVSTGATNLSGDLGVSPSIVITGFPPGTVGGTIHAGDAAAARARSDVVTTYNDAADRTPDSTFAGDLNGQTFHPGVYRTAAAFALTGTLTLDAEGDPNAIFIFQVGAAMNTAAASNVNLIGGAQASHVSGWSTGQPV